MIILRPRNRVLVAYTSLSVGASGTDPPNNPPWWQSWADDLTSAYGADAPTINCQGVSGQQIATVTTNFTTSIGKFNPDVVLIDGCPNDLGVTQGALDALWTKLADGTLYANGVKPRSVGWFSTWVRGDESEGGTNQAQIQTDNTLQAARTLANNGNFADGTTFLNIWQYWKDRRSILNPTNATTGVLTGASDGTHQNPKGMNGVWLPVIRANVQMRAA